MTDRIRHVDGLKGYATEETEPVKDSSGSSGGQLYQESSRVTKIHYQIMVIKSYLKMKVEEHDWHGVADAAMDLRELEAQLQVLK